MKIKQTTAQFYFFSIFLCAICNDAFSQWTKTATFESGTAGNKAEGASGFDGAGSATTFSSDRSVNGSKSAKMVWPQGSDGWAIAHGFFQYPQNVSNGQEIWARGYFYFASPWNWSCSPVVKVLRGVHVSNSGSNVGYHSVFSDNSGNILLSNEIGDAQISTGIKWDKDRWQCVEMYVKLSISDPVFRIWKDGILIYEDRSHSTLKSSSNYADFAYIMTYWNGGAPQNQTEYVDEFIITTEKPSKIDSKGNPMIGPIGGTSCGGPDPWTNTSFTQQTGTFTADFDVIPSGNNVDGVVGLSNSAAGTYADLACIVRFNTNGNIDARSGSVYQAINTIPYTSGTSYHVKMDVNINTKKYDVYVTPQGGSQQTIASQYDFRTEQNTVTQLNNWAKNTASCSLDVKNFTSGITTSVKSDLDTESLPYTIYPNPFSEFTTIDFSGIKKSSGDNLGFYLYNLLGKEVAIYGNISTDKLLFEKKDLAQGVYIYKIMLNEKYIGSGKLIVQ